MATEDTAFGYTVWGSDRALYGPVELPELVNWIKDERVTGEQWVFADKDQSWLKAADLPELQIFFRRRDNSGAPTEQHGGLKAGALRRIKILADLSDEQLERFIQIMEIHHAPQWKEIVRQNDHGDAMYLILEGELRVRLLVSGKESILATLSVGEFFGEISLFDQGPRSADVIANKDSTLLKISAAAFDRLTRTAPDLAAPFLMAVVKTLSARIRSNNKRYRDSLAFARAAE